MSGSVLVTGGAGFIGRRLVRRLLEGGRTVTVLDALVPSVHGEGAGPPPELEGARFLQGDVRDPDALGQGLAGAALVYHLAAETGTGESMYRARHYVDVNVGGTALLCDLAGAAGARPARVVLASSRAVYGEGPYRCPRCGTVHPPARDAARLARGAWEPPCPRCGGEGLEPLPAGAGAELRPTSVYGVTKRDQEELLVQLLPPRGVEVVSLRLQNVYGPGQSLRNPYTGILSIFSARLLAGEEVQVFEDGRESRDFVWVDDVVEALLRAGRAPLPAHGPAAGSAPAATLTVDVGSGRATSVGEVAHALADLYEVPRGRVRVTGEYRLGDVRHASGDPSGLRRGLGVTAATSLEEGLPRLGAWVRESARGASELGRALDEMRSAGLLGRAAEVGR